MSRRGRLVVVEGLDGVGKTTLATSLAQRTGATFLTTPSAPLRALRDRLEAELSSADSRQLFYALSVLEVSEHMKERLARGEDLILDRYWLSTLAYGALRATRLGLLEVEALLQPADLTLLLHASTEERRRRLAQRGLSAADRASLDPAAEALVEEHFRRGLALPIAGLVRQIDVTHDTPESALARVLVALPWRLRGLPGLARSQPETADGPFPAVAPSRPSGVQRAARARLSDPVRARVSRSR